MRRSFRSLLIASSILVVILVGSARAAEPRFALEPGLELRYTVKRACEPAGSVLFLRRLHDPQGRMSCGFPGGAPGVSSLGTPFASMLSLSVGTHSR